MIQKIDDAVRYYTGSDAFGANAMAAVVAVPPVVRVNGSAQRRR
jgi:hypothetical protein